MRMRYGSSGSAARRGRRAPKKSWPSASRKAPVAVARRDCGAYDGQQRVRVRPGRGEPGRAARPERERRRGTSEWEATDLMRERYRGCRRSCQFTVTVPGLMMPDVAGTRSPASLIASPVTLVTEGRPRRRWPPGGRAAAARRSAGGRRKAWMAAATLACAVAWRRPGWRSSSAMLAVSRMGGWTANCVPTGRTASSAAVTAAIVRGRGLPEPSSTVTVKKPGRAAPDGSAFSART